MRKKLETIKKYLTVFLIVALSINNFAAIVSDNDGSAFISKAEFDALKSSFQAQIDTYNQSIDNKIDGAIASYLSGIKVSTKEEIGNLYAKYSISGLVTSSGEPAPIYWTSNPNYTWNSESAVLISSHNILSSKDINRPTIATTSWTKPDCWAGFFEWNLTNKNIFERYTTATIGGVTKYPVTGIYIVNQTPFLACLCERRFQAPGTFGHAANFGDTYDRLKSKSKGLAGQLTQYANAVNNWSSYTVTTYGEEYENYVQGSSTMGKNYDTYYALAPNSTGGNSYGIIDTNDVITWVDSGTRQRIDTAFGLTSADLQSVAPYKTPTSINWADLTWPINVKWKCDVYLTPANIIYNDFMIVSAKNREIKCGIVLCDIEKKGKYEISLKPNQNGTITIYRSTSALADRGAASGTKQLYNVTRNVENKFVYNIDDVATGDSLWLVYEPTNVADLGILEDVHVILEKEN